MAYRQVFPGERKALVLQLIDEFRSLPRMLSDGCPFNSSACTEAFSVFVLHAEEVRSLFPAPADPLAPIDPAPANGFRDEAFCKFLLEVEAFRYLVETDPGTASQTDAASMEKAFDRFLAGVQMFQFWYAAPRVPYRLDIDALMRRAAGDMHGGYEGRLMSRPASLEL